MLSSKTRGRVAGLLASLAILPVLTGFTASSIFLPLHQPLEPITQQERLEMDIAENHLRTYQFHRPPATQEFKPVVTKDMEDRRGATEQIVSGIDPESRLLEYLGEQEEITPN